MKHCEFSEEFTWKPLRNVNLGERHEKYLSDLVMLDAFQSFQEIPILKYKKTSPVRWFSYLWKCISSELEESECPAPLTKLASIQHRIILYFRRIQGKLVPRRATWVFIIVINNRITLESFFLYSPHRLLFELLVLQNKSKSYNDKITTNYVEMLFRDLEITSRGVTSRSLDKRKISCILNQPP